MLDGYWKRTNIHRKPLVNVRPLFVILQIPQIPGIFIVDTGRDDTIFRSRTLTEKRIRNKISMVSDEAQAKKERDILRSSG